jgi:hypothetical protein
VACEAGGGAERKERIRLFDAGIPSEAEREAVVWSVVDDWSTDVSGVCESRARLGSVLEECEEWWSKGGREGTKRSSYMCHRQISV